MPFAGLGKEKGAGAKLYFKWILLDSNAKAGLCVSPGLEILRP